MSIATEISRLQTAKADIKTAIEAKGVTVPSNATLDTYDTYVSQISGGGGGTNYLEQYANKSLSGAISSTQLGTSIGSNMAPHLFDEQQSITSVDLTGTGATKITDYFCYHCTRLSTVTIPNTVTQIGQYFCAESGLPTQPSLPSSVTKIGNYYLQRTGIYAATIPSTITSLGSDCFNSCSGLVQVTYNASIATLPQAFCTSTDSLALVDLNSSVTSIGRYCFTRNSASTNLLEVVLRNTSGVVTLPNAIGSTSYNAAFKNRRNIKLYVPSALIASYEADSNWAAGITAGYLTIVALEGSQYE